MPRADLRRSPLSAVDRVHFSHREGGLEHQGSGIRCPRSDESAGCCEACLRPVGSATWASMWVALGSDDPWYSWTCGQETIRMALVHLSCALAALIAGAEETQTSTIGESPRLAE